MTSDNESQIHMVDITNKEVSAREAVAACSIVMDPETVKSVLSGELEKGDALEVARVAAVLGAKKTPEVVPLCHPIAVGAVSASFEPTSTSIEISVAVRTADRTGVEMEALVAAAAAALTIYDMIKSVDRGAEIKDLRLVHKSGGRSGQWDREMQD